MKKNSAPLNESRTKKQRRMQLITDDFSRQKIDIAFWTEIHECMQDAQEMLYNAKGNSREIKRGFREIAWLRVLCYKWSSNGYIIKDDRLRIREYIPVLEELHLRLHLLINDMAIKDLEPRITSNKTLAVHLERLNIPYKLVSQAELVSVGEPITGEEVAAMDNRTQAERKVIPLPRVEPRITSSTKLAAQLERLNIPYKLVSQAELAKIG